jgi:hypothetical protein
LFVSEAAVEKHVTAIFRKLEIVVTSVTSWRPVVAAWAAGRILRALTAFDKAKV